MGILFYLIFPEQSITEVPNAHLMCNTRQQKEGDPANTEVTDISLTYFFLLSRRTMIINEMLVNVKCVLIHIETGILY